VRTCCLQLDVFATDASNLAFLYGYAAILGVSSTVESENVVVTRTCI
jgi:hypothetical protein